MVERAIEKADFRHENQRVLRLVPSTRRHLVNSAVTGVLLVAAVALGLTVGSLGSKERVVPRIAPNDQLIARLTSLPATAVPPRR